MDGQTDRRSRLLLHPRLRHRRHFQSPRARQQESLKTFKRGGRVGRQRALPDDAHPPPEIQKAPDDLRIPLPVRTDLRFPELPARRGNGRKPTAVMPVPEAAMDENDCIAAWEDQVWLPRKLLPGQMEPKSPPMQEPPDDEFRLRVPAADGRHHPGSHNSGNHVNHLSIVYFRIQESGG